MNHTKHIEYLAKNGQWAELMMVARYMWDQQAWLYLKRNRNAVKRIKEEFTRLAKRPAYSNPANAQHWDQQIAKYIDRLGVKTLIDDMRQVLAKYPSVRSIIYFLYTGDNKASRWEMLLREQIAQEIQQQKELDNEAYKAMAEVFGFELKSVNVGPPKWVVDARRRLAAIDKMAKTDEVCAEIVRIKHNLEKHGYGLE